MKKIIVSLIFFKSLALASIGCMFEIKQIKKAKNKFFRFYTNWVSNAGR